MSKKWDSKLKIDLNFYRECLDLKLKEDPNNRQYIQEKQEIILALEKGYTSFRVCDGMLLK